MTWVGVSPFPLSATRESSTAYSKGGGEDWGDCSVSADLVLSSSDAGDRRVGVKGKKGCRELLCWQVWWRALRRMIVTFQYTYHFTWEGSIRSTILADTESGGTPTDITLILV